MATTTPNYGLTKPDGNEYYNVEDFNANADKVDAALASLSTAVGGKAPAAHTHAQADVTGLPAALAGKATTVTYTVTLPNTGWSTGTGQYTRAVAVAGILATDDPITDIVRSTTAVTRSAQIDAWNNVQAIITSANTITVYAYAVPATALTIQLKCVR